MVFTRLMRSSKSVRRQQDVHVVQVVALVREHGALGEVVLLELELGLRLRELELLEPQLVTQQLELVARGGELLLDARDLLAQAVELLLDRLEPLVEVADLLAQRALLAPRPRRSSCARPRASAAAPRRSRRERRRRPSGRAPARRPPTSEHSGRSLVRAARTRPHAQLARRQDDRLVRAGPRPFGFLGAALRPSSSGAARPLPAAPSTAPKTTSVGSKPGGQYPLWTRRGRPRC